MQYTKITPILLSFLCLLNVACTQGGAGTAGQSSDNPSNNPQPDPITPQGSLSSTLTTENFQNYLSTQVISSNGKRLFTWTITNTAQNDVKDLFVTLTPNVQIVDSNSTCGKVGFTLKANASCAFTLNYTAPNISEEPGTDSFTLSYSDKSNSTNISKTLSFKVLKGLYYLPYDLPDYNGSAGPGILNIVAGNNNAIYLGTNRGMSIVTNGKDGYLYNTVASLRAMQPIITNISVDSAGTIYVATQENGFFIGTDKTPFTLVKDTDKYYINTAYVDINKNIYFGCSPKDDPKEQICTLNKIDGNLTFFPTNGRVIKIAGNAENVYCLTDMVELYSSKNGPEGPFSRSESFHNIGTRSGNTTSLYVDKNMMYVGTSSGKIFISVDTNTFTQLTGAQLPDQAVNSIYTHNGTAYFAAGNKLYYGTIDPSTSQFQPTADKPLVTPTNIYSIFANETGEIFVGTASGLFTGKENMLSTENSLRSEAYGFSTTWVKSLTYMDAKGTIIFGTSDHGLMVGTHGPTGYSYTSLSNPNLTCVGPSVSDSKGTLYVAPCKDDFSQPGNITQEKGLLIGKKNAANEYIFTNLNPFKDLNITSLIVGSDDLIYATTETGVLYIGKDETFSQASDMTSISSVFVDSKGTVYVWVNNDGVYSAKKETDPNKKYTFTKLNDVSPPFEEIQALFVNPQDIIYVGSRTGLYKLTGKEFSLADNDTDAAKRNVLSIAGNENGAIFFGTSYSLPIGQGVGGLYYNSPDKPSTFNNIIEFRWTDFSTLRQNSHAGVIGGTLGSYSSGDGTNKSWTMDALGIFAFDPH